MNLFNLPLNSIKSSASPTIHAADPEGDSKGGLPSSSEVQRLINLDVQQIALEVQRDQQYNKQKQKSRKAKDTGGDPEEKDMFIEETLIVMLPDDKSSQFQCLEISRSQMMTSDLENTDDVQ